MYVPPSFSFNRNFDCDNDRGGGIGGLALATFLAASSNQNQNPRLSVSLYEAAPSLTELGAGVGVWLRTWRILQFYSFNDDGGGESAGAGAELADELRKVAPPGRNMSDAPRLSPLTSSGSGTESD